MYCVQGVWNETAICRESSYNLTKNYNNEKMQNSQRNLNTKAYLTIL